MIQTWVVYHIQIIGEAASKLSDGFQRRYPHVPWAEIVGMRHVLIHDYFRINLETVWATAQEDLPRLKQQVQGILAELEDG